MLPRDRTGKADGSLSAATRDGTPGWGVPNGRGAGGSSGVDRGGQDGLVTRRRRPTRPAQPKSTDGRLGTLTILALGLVAIAAGWTWITRDHQPLFGVPMVALGLWPYLLMLRPVFRRARRPRGARRPAAPLATSRVPIAAGLRFAVLRRDGFRCAYCGRGEGEGVQLHIDHLVPVARGGKNELENLVTSCAPCNLGKSASDLLGA